MFVHGELGGSWLWERYLGYFAHRGWEGHAINLRAHYWSDTTEVSGIDFDSYVFDVIAAFEHVPPNPVLDGTRDGRADRHARWPRSVASEAWC